MLWIWSNTSGCITKSGCRMMHSSQLNIWYTVSMEVPKILIHGNRIVAIIWYYPWSKTINTQKRLEFSLESGFHPGTVCFFKGTLGTWDPPSETSPVSTTSSRTISSWHGQVAREKSIYARWTTLHTSGIKWQPTSLLPLSWPQFCDHVPAESQPEQLLGTPLQERQVDAAQQVALVSWKCCARLGMYWKQDGTMMNSMRKQKKEVQKCLWSVSELKD